MRYDFDEIIKQDGLSAKWHWYHDATNTIPLWLADMDFKTSVEITDALITRVQQGVYGYTMQPNSYQEAIVKWQLNRNNWPVQKEWIISTSGTISSINIAIQAFTNKGDSILIQTPIYHSFFKSILNNERLVQENPLIYDGQQYLIDFDGLEDILKNKSISLFLLCNPHNPTGKVYSEEELLLIIQLCKKYNVLIISDEIHSDLMLPNFTHIPLGHFYNIYENIIVITSPTKTFNLAGLKMANVIIPNPHLRESFLIQQRKNGNTSLNTFALIACETAYNYGESWLSQVLEYINKNRDYVITFVKEYIPELNIIPAGGTYFLWIDCNRIISKGENIDKVFLNKANIRVSLGNQFGNNHDKFVRINIACRKDILKEAFYNLSNIYS